MRQRRYPSYAPGSDGALAIWLDGQDTSTSSLLDTGGGSISDTETVGTWKTKAGNVTRTFVQSGSAGRPTFVANAINGFSALRFNSQVLNATTVQDMQSMSGYTVAMALKRVTTNGGGNNAAFSVAIGTGTSLVLASCSSEYRIGGRRLAADTFTACTGDNLSDGQAFIQSGVWDWANGKISLFQGGVLKVREQAFQTAGTTAAADPFSVSVGGRVESGLDINLATDCYIGELLVWFSARTPDQLVGPHAYLASRWRI